MDAATRLLVRTRAGGRCEYCLIAQEHDLARLQVEHIIARQHGGDDSPGNFALACLHCNLHKGTNLAGIDRLSGRIAPLFHPRRDLWDDHFVLREALIEGRTPAGRATVEVLRMNADIPVLHRSTLLRRDAYP